jgi:RimJ/RimL family protein N-acetyltransferase/NTP pyrophosphatase (non-canonical NTP hydrolase)
MEEIILLNNFRLDGNLVYIKQPNFAELDFVAELWSEEETMKDVGGIISFPKEKREAWYKKMIEPSDGKNFYCLIYTLDDIPVGEVSFHRFDVQDKKADLNIKVQNKYRCKGYAKEAMQLLLSYYFYYFGGQVIYDNVINEKGQKALESFGFDIISRTDSEILFEMTKEMFMKLQSMNGTLKKMMKVSLCNLENIKENNNLNISEMLELSYRLWEKHKHIWSPMEPEYGKDFILYMIEEIGESIAIIKKKGEAKIMDDLEVRARFVEELGDVLMYYMDVLNRFNISAEEFSAAYIKKFENNMERNYKEQYEKFT